MGRKYTNTIDLLKSAGADQELVQKTQSISEGSRLSRILFALRCKSGMTQGDVAKHAGCAQSVISRIENSRDEDLSMGDIFKYADALDLQLNIGFLNRRETLADRFRYHLHSLTKCAREILDLAGNDLQILRGATDMFCESANHFCQVLDKSAKQLNAAAEKDKSVSESHESPLIINAPEPENCCKKETEHSC